MKIEWTFRQSTTNLRLSLIYHNERFTHKTSEFYLLSNSKIKKKNHSNK